MFLRKYRFYCLLFFISAALGTLITVDNEPDLLSAVFAISTGDTIFISNGDYHLTNTLHLYGGAEDVAIIGQSRDGVRIIGPGMSNESYGTVPHLIMISDIARAYIADMTLMDVYYHPITVQSPAGAWAPVFENLHIIDAGEQFIKVNTAEPPTSYCDSGVVRNCVFEFTDRARHWYTNGVDILAADGWIIENNSFIRIRGPVGILAGPAVLVWQNSINTIVRNNVFIDCDIAISMGNPAGPGTIARNGETVYDNQNSVVVNNVIHRSGDGDVGITLNRARNALVAHNTVVLESSFPWTIEYRFTETSGTIANNLTDGPIFQRDGGVCTLSDNIDYAETGWFIDASSGNLHILPTSAAIDACPVLSEVTLDIDGESRPYGPFADAGADEYHSGSETVESRPFSSKCSIYPNPFNSCFTVNSDRAFSLQIFDVNGNLTFENNEPSASRTLRFSDKTESGCYLIRLNFAGTCTDQTRKIVYIK